MITERVRCALQILAEANDSLYPTSIETLIVRLSVKFFFEPILSIEVIKILHISGYLTLYSEKKQTVHESKRLHKITLREIIMIVNDEFEIDQKVSEQWSLSYSLEEALRIVTVDDLAKTGNIIKGFEYNPKCYSQFDIDSWERSITETQKHNSDPAYNKFWKRFAQDIVNTERERPIRMSRTNEIMKALKA